MTKQKKQYVEIEKLDWGMIKDYMFIYPIVIVVNICIGLYFIITSFIPIYSLGLLGKFIGGEYNLPDFYKKIKLKIKS